MLSQVLLQEFKEKIGGSDAPDDDYNNQCQLPPFDGDFGLKFDAHVECFFRFIDRMIG
jgi:hypothetical protein